MLVLYMKATERTSKKNMNIVSGMSTLMSLSAADLPSLASRC